MNGIIISTMAIMFFIGFAICWKLSKGYDDRFNLLDDVNRFAGSGILGCIFMGIGFFVGIFIIYLMQLLT